MQLTNTVAIASAAFAAGAYALPDVSYVTAIVRDITTVEKNGLWRRDECSDEADDFLNAITDDPPPTPDSDLASALASYASDNDIPTPTGCEDVSITGEVGSSYTSYSSEFMSWWTAHTPDLQEFYSACSDVDGFSESLVEIATGCSSLLADVTGSSKGKGGDSDESNDDDEDFAPRQTAAAMAAIGVAALVGAVM